MIRRLIILLLLSLLTPSWGQDCVDGVEVELWDVCYNIENTDSSLDIITWNIEQFPKQGESTIEYLVEIIQFSEFDIIALQEISDDGYFTQLINELNDPESQNNWVGYRSGAGSWGELAYIINTSTIDIIQSPYTILNSFSHYFAYREPYILEITFSNDQFFIINNHYKCCGDNIIQNDYWDEEYRRQQASLYLQDYINTNLADENVIVLGDLNDVLTDPEENNVFWNFISNPNEYMFVDMDIAEGSPNNWSYPTWPSHIDHILITNELFDNVVSINTVLYDTVLTEGWFEYDYFISDHRPVGIQLLFYETSSVEGCTDPEATNYNPDATVDDGSCEYCELGDMNCDGGLNVLDIVSLVNIIMDDGEYTEYGDVNGDGYLSILDVGQLINLVLFGNDVIIEGCMDDGYQQWSPYPGASACNYNPDAIVDDGSCEYAEENYDCDGNCMIEIDCAGVCGGSLLIDDCGVCGENNDCIGCNDWYMENFICDYTEATDKCCVEDDNNNDNRCKINGTGNNCEFSPYCQEEYEMECDLDGNYCDYDGAAVGNPCSISEGSFTEGEGLCRKVCDLWSGFCFNITCNVFGEYCDYEDAEVGTPCSASEGSFTEGEGLCVLDLSDDTHIPTGYITYYDTGCADGTDSCCTEPECNEPFTLSLEYIDASTLQVNYSSPEAIGGFQFDVDGATTTGGFGGDAAANNFGIFAMGSTLLSFDQGGGSIPAGSGILTNLNVDTGVSTQLCLQNVIISDPESNEINSCPEYWQLTCIPIP